MLNNIDGIKEDSGEALFQYGVECDTIQLELQKGEPFAIGAPWVGGAGGHR